MDLLWAITTVACLTLLFKLTQLATRPRSALAHIPGPWYAKYTSLGFTFNALVPRIHVYVDDLHREYGPVVRITPDMVAIADPDGVADIFRSSRGYLKGPVYESLLRSFFATRDPVLHGQRRRLFARPLANSSLQAFWADEIRERVTLTVQRIKSDAENNGEGDAYKWWNIMANDVITRLSFGESLFLLETDEHLPYIEAVKKTIRCSSLNRNFPRIMPWLKYLPIPRLQEILQARPKVERYTAKAVQNFRTHGKQQIADNISRNIFTQIVAQADKTDNDAIQVITDEDVHDEALTLMLGGTDSTSSTLTYATWAVLSHSEIRDELEQEVAALSDDLSPKELEHARLLNAVIHETLRLYGPVSVGLQRVVPPGGARIAGFDLAPGTLVWPQMYVDSRSVYTINRTSG
ncbi:Cytochrome P450 [Lecanosticta acicola]|uniref:Cytochrome P450 n=1 Tax=Lecanosticta acicola TaxID=111012 RepID=A0AAI8YWC1_9PEZI|nr:Cytochrome P450 [Lecanosticta acicola]